jgi:hypothetical protein
MGSLRARFALLAAVLLVAGAGFQYAGVSMSINQSVDSSSGNPGFPNGWVLMSVISTLSGFCVAVAVALVVAIIASLVIDEAAARWGVRGESDDSDVSAELAAYGSDPELL